MGPSFQYIKDHGITTTQNYNYKGRNGICNREKKHDPKVTVTGHELQRKIDTEELSRWLSEGAVSVALEVQRDFQMYKSGVFKAPKTCGMRRNHAVLLSGQGRADGIDIYTIKNSWG